MGIRFNSFTFTACLYFFGANKQVNKTLARNCNQVKAPSVGIEPTTTWLKATRSTAELRRLADDLVQLA